jgi:hypothetical protein
MLNILDCRQIVTTFSVLSRFEGFDKDCFQGWDYFRRFVGSRKTPERSRF